MNQNKLLYNIVKIAGSVANQGTNYDYDKLSSGIQESMAYRYGQQLGKDQRAQQRAYTNAARYVREGRLTPDEAQRRLDARNKRNYQFDDRYLDAIRDYPKQKDQGFQDTNPRDIIGFINDIGNTTRKSVDLVGRTAGALGKVFKQLGQITQSQK